MTLPRLDVQDTPPPVCGWYSRESGSRWPAVFELTQMVDHHVGVERVRAVVVEMRPLLIAHFVVALVVIIVAEHADIIAEAIHERFDERRFPLPVRRRPQ